ncbi:MAG TPA: LLM class flavin-dependent oxidoreductase [Epulopiscium sp.]|nr:LLM class flavin-dependent oxidoreductase [Candidatus Epulonipiscium sp.]
MSIQNDLKARIYGEGFKIKTVAIAMNSKYGTGMNPDRLGQKINRENIHYKEVLQMAEIIGYRLEWVKKETDE